MNILESLVNSLRSAAQYNKHELAVPQVIIWPDEERLWEQCIASLRESYPLLWSLGDYNPDKATGPAAWLRCQLDMQKGADVPVIYLPGVGRSAFRSAEQCQAQAKHLFALQFLGQLWTQRNGKDWTPFAYFSTAEGGLGLDVASDQNTKKAIQESLAKLLEVELDALRGRKLEAGDFRAVVTTDPVRTLLRWMGDPAKVKRELEKSGAEWTSFRAVCKDSYGFDPDKEGAITAAEKLSNGDTKWSLVWNRYKEAPTSYPGIKELLESSGEMTLFEKASEYKPRSNQKEEERLEADLLSLADVSLKDAISKIKALAEEHGPRAAWTWATLGESQLALAIGHLRDLADIVQTSGNPSTLDGMAEYYSTTGWKADRMVLLALYAARSTAATKAVTVAVRAVYLPWLEKFSILTQSLAATYPVNGPKNCRAFPIEEGTVYLFADGLRMDMARSLEEELSSMDMAVNIDFHCDWAALPTVTATAKPAWRPLADKLGGPLEGTAFQPKELENNKVLVHARFKQLMKDLGIIFLEPNDLSLPTGCAWTESGSFDTYGHDQGAKLAWRVKEELAGLKQRITELLDAGWSKVKVVTDHGWLLVPGGLPKTELPKHLAESRWGRCAIPSAGAKHGYQMTPWFWDSSEAVVLAPGISCFAAGMEYAHGGLTLQEALAPTLTIVANKSGNTGSIVLKEIKWVGLRLNIVVDGAPGLDADIRLEVSDSTTSFISSPVKVAADGKKTSLLVTDDEALGMKAFLVIVDASAQPVFKQSIVIGGN